MQFGAYMADRAMQHSAWPNRPSEPWDRSIRGQVPISVLRAKLIDEKVDLVQPVQMTVVGTLFPSALLSSGWWERASEAKIRHINWKDNVQKWLFHGFHQWAPSWDFTWNLEQWDSHADRDYFIAQLADGDEANSIPVLIPREIAVSARQQFEKWGGIMQAEVTGLLGRRDHFEGYVKGVSLDLFGGLLDYCLWLNPDDRSHGITTNVFKTEVYSGYLWKCLAPEEAVAKQAFCLNDVYFVWEHANFIDEDAVKYALDALEHKQRYIEKKLGRRKLGSMKLIQKSCSLVPGTEVLSDLDVYSILLGRRGRR